MLDLMTPRVATRAAGASDDVIDAAAGILRTATREALFGTLALAALADVLVGRRR